MDRFAIKQTAPFFRLPHELRDHIYRLAGSFDHLSQRIGDGYHGGLNKALRVLPAPVGSILLVCKQMSSEYTRELQHSSRIVQFRPLYQLSNFAYSTSAGIFQRFLMKFRAIDTLVLSLGEEHYNALVSSTPSYENCKLRHDTRPREKRANILKLSLNTNSNTTSAPSFENCQHWSAFTCATTWTCLNSRRLEKTTLSVPQ